MMDYQAVFNRHLQ